MTREEALSRISEGLGFRPDLESFALTKLKDAQVSLEMGKSLPYFLLLEDKLLVTEVGRKSYLLPEGFIRETDYEPLRYFLYPEGITKPKKLRREFVENIYDLFGGFGQSSGAPTYYSIRRTQIDLAPTPDDVYTLMWSYYRHDDVVSDIDKDATNLWLTHGADWLVGEAGYRMAQVLRDPNAAAIFDGMRTMGRLAVLGEDIAREFSGRAYTLGAAN